MDGARWKARAATMKHTAFATILAAALAAPLFPGCLSVKTEHEVKPIHITMDVNLKVDREIEKALDGETRKPPRNAEKIRAWAEAGLVGVDNRGYVAPRGKLTPEQEDIVADANAARRAKMAEIADSTGAARADVEKRRAAKIRERLPAGKGIWYQEDSGEWVRKD